MNQFSALDMLPAVGMFFPLWFLW